MTPLLNKKEAAAKLNVSVKAIDDWVSENRIPFIKLGRLVRFSEDALNTWIEKRTIKARA